MEAVINLWVYCIFLGIVVIAIAALARHFLYNSVGHIDSDRTGRR